MEVALAQTENKDIKTNSAEVSELNPSQDTDNRKKTKPTKESSSPNQRKAKRRRRAITNGGDFNVNFSKVKISESSRVLRSKVKRNHQSTIEDPSEISISPQTDAVSKDHSYSKASKRYTKPKEHTKNTPTVHVKLFIGLTSNDDRHKEPSPDSDPLPISQHFYRRNSKIEIIDFDDLELSNDCHGDQGTKFDENFNDPAMEDRNLKNSIDQSNKDLNGSAEQRCIEVVEENKSDDHQDQFKSIDDSDQNSNHKTDYEKLLAKYGDGDRYLFKSSSLLEHPQWMLEPDIVPGNMIDRPRVTNEDSLDQPIYLDLDQNRITVSSPQKLPSINQLNSISGPMNFPSGGCFQKLGTVVTSTVTRPEFQYCDGTAPCCLSNNLCFASTDLQDERWYQEPPAPTTNAFPNFQAVFAQKIESLIRPRPYGYSPNGRSNLGVSSFSTSGGSIERIVSPVIPKQPSTLKKYPGISVPLEERNISTQTLAPETTSFDSQNGQQPECRIHLVETPPSFTRTTQPDVSPIVSRPQTIPDQISVKPQQVRPEPIQFSNSHLKASNKPKRTRRTRAQMEIYRQELARSCNHRSKRNQRFASRSARHIVGRNFSMEYHRVHNHPQEFLYTRPTPRISHYMRPQAVQQHRYSETYSVNETNLFGVSSNSGQWPQLVDHFPSFSHGLAELRSFEPFWPLNSEVKNVNAYMNASDPYQKYQEPLMEGLQNPSSVMWNQQVRSIQLQSAYGNVQQAPVTNSRLLSEVMRPFTPWQHSMAASLEQLSDNLADLTTDESINQLPYY